MNDVGRVKIEVLNPVATRERVSGGRDEAKAEAEADQKQKHKQQRQRRQKQKTAEFRAMNVNKARAGTRQEERPFIWARNE